MRNIKKINTILNRYGTAPTSDNATEETGSGGMGQQLGGVREKADRKRRLHAEAEARVKHVETELHAAIGLVLDNTAALKHLDPLDVLGLADLLKELLDQEAVRGDIRARGVQIYSARFARAVALTIVGSPSTPLLSEALRAAGFVRAGQFWSGRANIPQAIRLGKENGLTLLRYDEEDRPIYYLSKGIPQPALTELEAEHEDLLKVMRGHLAAPHPPHASQSESEDGQAAAGGEDARSGDAAPPSDRSPQNDKPETSANRTSGRTGFGRGALAKSQEDEA